MCNCEQRSLGLREFRSALASGYAPLEAVFVWRAYAWLARSRGKISEKSIMYRTVSAQKRQVVSCTCSTYSFFTSSGNDFRQPGHVTITDEMPAAPLPFRGIQTGAVFRGLLSACSTGALVISESIRRRTPGLPYPLA